MRYTLLSPSTRKVLVHNYKGMQIVGQHRNIYLSLFMLNSKVLQILLFFQASYHVEFEFQTREAIT